MKCYGHYGDNKSDCQTCEFLQSCQLYTVTEGRMQQTSYHQSYEEIEKFALDIADTSNIPGDNEEPETENYLGETEFLLDKGTKYVILGEDTMEIYENQCKVFLIEVKND